MNLIEFNKNFPTEESCKEYFKTKREESGLSCKKCGSNTHSWIKSEDRWRCKTCSSRVHLKSGTVMEKSKLSFQMWFTAMHLLTSTKKSFSAAELQSQLGLKRYEPAWYMLQKIRSAMGKRDTNYMLRGELEVDDAFFEIVDLPKKDELGNKIHKGEESKKRGRGSQKQAKVLLMVESKPNAEQKNPHRKNRIMGHVKMVVLEELIAEDITNEIEMAVEPSATILTDGYRSYNKLKEVVKNHKVIKVPAKEAGKALPWVHTVIANAKRLLLGIHHSISKEYLQNYLNEYCYKLNRRYQKQNLFERMIIAGVSDTWY